MEPEVRKAQIPQRAALDDAVLESWRQAAAYGRADAARALERRGRFFYPLVLVVLMLAVWEGAARLYNIPHYILPAPGLIVQTALNKYPVFLRHTGVTAQEVVGGGLLGIAVGMALALVMFLCSPLEKALYPLIVASLNVPVFAIAPLLVVWFGYGYQSKVIMAATIVFFPITVSTLDGLKRTDPDLIRLLRTMGASNRQILFKLRFPAALPALFSGLKLSAVYATIGAVVGEWVGAGAGLGYLMLSANAQLRIAEVFVAIMCLTPIGLLLLGGVHVLERWLLPWQTKSTDAGRN
jgi:ABC-type nitrate/sulfonate/bicarbonate transport system permease component